MASRCVHELIIQSDYDSNVFGGSSPVDMYTKCESIEDAWRQFDDMSGVKELGWRTKNWSYGKSGNRGNGRRQKAFELY